MPVTGVTCGWCHELVNVRAGGLPTYCPRCGHRADVARIDCDCPRCVGTLRAIRPQQPPDDRRA